MRFYDDANTMRMIFEADPWDSLISFHPGIRVNLGGTLDLVFDDQVDVSTQVGRTLRLFDWTGVTPTGQFHVTIQYGWDLSDLYTTGVITLLDGTILLGDANGDRIVDDLDFQIWDVHKFTEGTTWREGDFNGDQVTDISDLNIWHTHRGTRRSINAVPEPMCNGLAAAFLFLARARLAGQRTFVQRTFHISSDAVSSHDNNRLGL